MGQFATPPPRFSPTHSPDSGAESDPPVHRFTSNIVSVLGVPMHFGQRLPGVREAPSALRRSGLIDSIRELRWAVEDAGDIGVPSEDSIDSKGPSARLGQSVNAHHAQAVGDYSFRAAQQISAAAKAKKFCLTLGGDHSIAIGTIGGQLLAREDFAVVWVDAHGDINTPETSPSGNLHGMPLAILLGLCNDTLTAFSWLPRDLRPDQITMIGLRDLDPGDKRHLRETGIKVFTMQDIDRHGIGGVVERALNAVNPLGNRPIHLSFDIDSIDPFIAPSTGTRVRGGMTYREAHFVAEAMAETGCLVSMDMVEINPQLGDASAAAETVGLGIELISSALGKRIL